MNKSDIVDLVAKKTEQTKKAVQSVIDGLFEQIEESVTNGESVTIAGFGTFEPRNRSERSGHNPRTGESLVIPPSTSLTFRSSGVLKDRIKKANLVP